MSVKNILLIEDLEVEFKPGLNTLTGETGAGKSILLDCLGFVLGWSKKINLLREGADSGEVIAEFTLTKNHKVQDFLLDSGFETSDTIILRRNLQSGVKKSRFFINDRVCSQELSRALSGFLVELQGQNGNQGLLDIKTHISFLDAYADIEKELSDLEKAWKGLAQSKLSLLQHEESLLDARRDYEFLKFSVEEIKKFEPHAGEENTLDEKRRFMRSVLKNKEYLIKADETINSIDIEGVFTDCIRWLETSKSSLGSNLDQTLENLEQGLENFLEAQSSINELLSENNFDTLDLEKTEERLFALRALGRKHNVETNSLNELAEKFCKNLEKIELGDKEVRRLKDTVSHNENVYNACARDVSLKRNLAAKQLDSAIREELTYLKMGGAIFKTEINKDRIGPRGLDSVAFSVITNKGLMPGPLNKIASGGEMSRFLLALKVCLFKKDPGLTLIFDEIDQGVGGATADAVGRRLSALSELTQIIVVTHSPQVAGYGDYQWKVNKVLNSDKKAEIKIQNLSNHERVEEIARMLSGEVVTKEALAAAANLLK